MELAAALRQKIYLSRGRVLLRRLGMRRVLGLIAAVRALRARHRPAVAAGERATVHIGPWSAAFHISSPDESARVESLNGERRFLGRFLQEVRPGDVVYDVGANIGIYTAFLARAVGKAGVVVAFEPEGRCFARCLENLALNSLRNVRLFDCALGNQEQEIELVVDEAAASGVHHVLGGADGNVAARLQPARMVPGDFLVARESLPVPNVVKIDVEGFEEEVLLGLSGTLAHPQCRLVLCEIHFAVLDQRGRWDAPGRMIRFLQRCGFSSIRWLDSGHVMARRLPPAKE
jgi:FkbM family methyltransferase